MLFVTPADKCFMLCQLSRQQYKFIWVYKIIYNISMY